MKVVNARKFKTGEVRELLELIDRKAESVGVKLKGLQRRSVVKEVVLYRHPPLISRSGVDFETDIF